EAVQNFRAVLEVADDIAMRVDDVLDLRSDAFFLGRTHVGTDRASGGTYERPYLWVAVFGTDGLVTRSEIFDADRDEQALARFDELTGLPAPARPSRRRVRPNAASDHAARVNAAMAARDGDALSTLFADDCEAVEHTTGGRYDREGLLFSSRSLLRARSPAFRHEPLATFGDALALCRTSWSASGLTSAKFDVAAYEGQ